MKKSVIISLISAAVVIAVLFVVSPSAGFIAWNVALGVAVTLLIVFTSKNRNKER